MDFYLSAIALALATTMMAWGVYLSVRIFNLPDITTDGSFTLSAAITAVVLMNGNPWYIAVLAGIVGGVLAGMITAFIHAWLGVNALLGECAALWHLGDDRALFCKPHRDGALQHSAARNRQYLLCARVHRKRLSKLFLGRVSHGCNCLLFDALVSAYRFRIGVARYRSIGENGSHHGH